MFALWILLIELPRDPKCLSSGTGLPRSDTFDYHRNNVPQGARCMVGGKSKRREAKKEDDGGGTRRGDEAEEEGNNED